MRKSIALVFFLLSLLTVTEVLARGGQSSDDCPPGSKDPDCADATGAPKK